MAESPDVVRLAYGELDRARAAEVNAHVVGCLACQSRVAEYRALRRDALAAGQRPLPKNLWPAVASGIAQVPQESAPPAPSARLVPVGVATLLAAAIVVFVVMRGAVPTPSPDSTGVAGVPSSEQEYQALQRLARDLAQPSIRTLDDAVAEAEVAAKNSPGDAYLQRTLVRIRADRSAFDEQVGAIAAAVK